MRSFTVYFYFCWLNALALCSCGRVSSPADGIATQLHSFSEDIQSPVKSLDLKPGSTVMVPVTLHNTGQETWASLGRYPVDISYKWFDGGKMLPGEGERTVLPGPVNPGESTPVQVKVIAPESGKELLLKITLVQEGIQWFMLAGGKPLEIPATIH